MPGVKINFAEVESSFEPLPEGRYDCVIETVEVRESQSSDNDYLNFEMKVLDAEYEGRRLWMIASLSERALWRLKDTLVALEVIEEDDEVDIEWEDDVDVTPKEGPRIINPVLDGLGCVAVVTNEVYEGRERNKVNELVANDAGPQKKASSSRSKKSTSNSKPKASTSKSSSKTKAGSGGRQRKLR